MSNILFIVITVAFIFALIYLVNIIINKYYNIKALRKKPRLYNATEKQNGLIYKSKDKNLEADQSPITIF